MTGSGHGMMARGKSWDSVPDGSLGLTKEFPDVDFTASSLVKPQNTNTMVTCRLVKNSAGAALTPRQVVKYSTTAWGTEVLTVAGAGEVADGVVDEYLPSAGVADGDYFWIVVKGYTELIQSTNSGISVGDFVKTAASGKVIEDVATPITNAGFGRAIETTTNSGDVTFRAFVNFENM